MGKIVESPYDFTGNSGTMHITTGKSGPVVATEPVTFGGTHISRSSRSTDSEREQNRKLLARSQSPSRARSRLRYISSEDESEQEQEQKHVRVEDRDRMYAREEVGTTEIRLQIQSMLVSCLKDVSLKTMQEIQDDLPIFGYRFDHEKQGADLRMPVNGGRIQKECDDAAASAAPTLTRVPTKTTDADLPDTSKDEVSLACTFCCLGKDQRARERAHTRERDSLSHSIILREQGSRSRGNVLSVFKLLVFLVLKFAYISLYAGNINQLYIYEST